MYIIVESIHLPVDGVLSVGYGLRYNMCNVIVCVVLNIHVHVLHVQFIVCTILYYIHMQSV